MTVCKKFFADAVSHDYKIVALLSEEPDKISIKGLGIFTLQNLPNFVYELIDGIIFTDSSASDSVVDFLIAQDFDLTKVILWDPKEGWGNFNLPDSDDSDGSQVIYFCGLEFHIRNNSDANFFNETFRRLQTQWQVKNLNPQLYPGILAQQFQ